MKIMTYNIHGAKGLDGKCDYRRIGDFLKKQNIDIALIQEIDTRTDQRSIEEDINALITDHFHSFATAPTMTTPHGWYGNGVLSRFPISKENVIDISLSGREPRNIQEVFVEVPKGLLHLINTHKGLRRSERGLQIAKLHHLLSPQSDIPLVVGGDINQWHTYSRAMAQLNRLLYPIPSSATFPTRYPLFPLDRFWCRPKTLVQSSRVLKTKETRIFSDHYPLVIEINI